MSRRRTVMIGDFVTDEMLQQIKGIGPDADRIAREVIEPNMAEINRKTGQENDAKYLAYALVHAMNSIRKWHDGSSWPAAGGSA